MAERYSEYNETTDMYLDILREAQKVEDKKLIGLIQVRLQQLRQPVYVTSHGCRVITFPKFFLPVVKESRFWPRQAHMQIAVILTGYLLLLSIHTLF